MTRERSGVVEWSLVKGVLWLILLSNSISEVVAERRSVLTMQRWETSTEERIGEGEP